MNPPTPAEPAPTAHAAPHPGSQQMPPWNVGELIDAPRFGLKNWAMMLGPGLVMGGAAIGGGEWLTGPQVCAKYGGGMLWLATLSILGQVIYNVEISRYTLYTGEPIFTGKFRTLPGPWFWVCVYLVLDFGSIFPYLAANASTPLATLILGQVPDVKAGQATLGIFGRDFVMSHELLLRLLSYAVFLGAMVPLIFGGKVFNALKAVMTFKIFTVMSFLLVLGIVYSEFGTWAEIFSGFVKFGNVPVQRAEDTNGNGVLDPGEDWDGDNLDNLFAAAIEGRALPPIDWSMMAFLSALVAISGSGGLSNTPVSNYTRDQGWGMGYHVGAIPSMIGGHNLQLSHVGTVFEVTPQALPRWRRWYRHVLRDQLVVWMPACFLGLALPSMLSVEFLPRGTMVADKWVAASMTAGAVQERVGGQLGALFWFMTLFCGFLVLAPTMATSSDGIVRRWVDVFWTASGTLRRIDPKNIRYVYFGVLVVYAVFGMIMLSLHEPATLLVIATMIYNFALGFSCWHALVINRVLLPRELRPSWSISIALFLAGAFFWLIAIVATLQALGMI